MNDALRARVQPRHRLGRGVAQVHAVEVEVDRPDEVGAARDVGGLAGQRQRAAGQLDLEAHARLRRHRVLAHMVVEEQEAAVAVAAHGPARRLQVGERGRHALGLAHRHRRELGAVVAQEVVEGAQLGQHRALLAVGAERRLEVVANPRRVVVAAAQGAFLQPRAAHADRVAAAVEHVVAQQVDARAELHRQHGRDVVRRHQRATAVHGRQAGAVLRAEERHLVHVGLGGTAAVRLGLRTEVAADAAAEAEGIGLLGRQLGRALGPGLVRVAAEHRRDLAGRIDGAVPAGHGVQRHVHAGLDGQGLQRADVGLALAGAAQVVFVLQLHTDDGAAVLPQQALDLRADLGVEALDMPQILGVIAARGHRVDDPVRDAAVASLAMRPGAQAHHHFQAGSLGQLHEAAQVPIALPVEAARLLLVVVPEHVAGDDVDAGGLRQAQLGVPLRGRRAAVVVLAHDRQPRLAVAQQVLVVGGQRLALGRARGPELQMAGLRCRRLSPRIKLEQRLRARCGAEGRP
jgi:hypothetical protein